MDDKHQQIAAYSSSSKKSGGVCHEIGPFGWGQPSCAYRGIENQLKTLSKLGTSTRMLGKIARNATGTESTLFHCW